METGANIVRRYAKSEPVERIDIICAHYENFTSIIDSFEVGVFHLISCEKAYNRQKRKADLGVRIQNGKGHSDPTGQQAVENVMIKDAIRECFEHINEIKVGLGISGVLTEVHSWSAKPDKNSGVKGARIDMVIVRNDRIINLCEMKYSIGEYSFTGKDDESLRNKIAALKTVCKTRYSFHPVLVTTYGLKEGMYSGRIQAVIKMDDLFHRI